VSSDDAPVDPDAVRRAYHQHRARRHARVERRRRQRHAGVRFWIVLVLLIAGCGVLAVVAWQQISRLFGV
jgi:hypothetical protein